MIKIKLIEGIEAKRLFAGSIYKAMSEYMEGKPITIQIDPNIDLRKIGDYLIDVAEIIVSAQSIFHRKRMDEDEEDDDDFLYRSDDDDPADFWKK